MRRLTKLILYVALSSIPFHAKVVAQTYYSMRFSETNMRTGNTTTHPVLAVYWQRGTPFEVLSVLYPERVYTEDVEAESQRFEGKTPSWYRVCDFEGQTGWIKSNQLGATSTVMVLGTSDILEVPMFAEIDDVAPIALLPKYLVMRRIDCRDGWCMVRFNDATHGHLEGWVARVHLWGDVGFEASH